MTEPKNDRDYLEALVRERTEKLERSFREVERLNKIFRAFVPAQFLQRLHTLDSKVYSYLEEEEATILFSDIRSYTRFTENMTPQENLKFINSVFEAMEPCVSGNHGFVDKFIGDGIMGVFDKEDSADHALQAAIAMQRALEEYNRKWKAHNSFTVEMGIGINTGSVLMGTVGSPNRMDSTVIGDAVNLTSRLERLTKRYRSKILISHHTQAKLTMQIEHIREIETLQVRGREEPVALYEVFETEPEDVIEKKMSSRGLWFRGLSLYRGQFFEEAITAFEEYQKILPDDPLGREYIERCRYFQKNPPDEDDFYFWERFFRGNT